jgi:hypothetical protein
VFAGVARAAGITFSISAQWKRNPYRNRMWDYGCGTGGDHSSIERHFRGLFPREKKSSGDSSCSYRGFSRFEPAVLTVFSEKTAYRF